MTGKKAKLLHPLQIRVSDEVLAELKSIAAVEQRSMSNLIFRLICEAVDARRAAAKRVDDQS